MRMPDWSPRELIDIIEQIEGLTRPLPDAQRHQSEGEMIEAQMRAGIIIPSRRLLYLAASHIGKANPLAEQLRIARALATDERLKEVWKRIRMRTNRSQPPLPKEIGSNFALVAPSGSVAHLHGYISDTKLPVQGLFFACVSIFDDWKRLRKWTRAEARTHYQEIAKRAERLEELLVAESDAECVTLTAVSRYVPDAMLKALARSLGMKDDDFTGANGAAAFAQEFLDEMLPDLAHVAAELAKRARQLAKAPGALTQPKNLRAEHHFFARCLSAHFLERYGTPLHAHVAAIENAIFEFSPGSSLEVTEDEVRGWCTRRQRSRKTHRSRRGGGIAG
jgi:hypothetical protein